MKKFFALLSIILASACGKLPGTKTPCQEFGHTSKAVFQREIKTPENQMRVEVDELGGHPVARGKISAVVSGFGGMAHPARDSFFLLIETMHDDRYRVVFSGDSWWQGDNMMTRWTAQHFAPGGGRQELMAEFEHWIHQDRQYLYTCSWDERQATCKVAEIGSKWGAELVTRFAVPLGPLAKPLVFGDMAAPGYQSMGQNAIVQRGCVSIY